MIYDKDAAFSYPILNNHSNSYKESSFILDVDLLDDNKNFIFNINYDIHNEFIKKLINKDKAALIFIVQSKDNYFTKLNKDQKTIIIPKNRISMSNSTIIQLHIQSLAPIEFFNCYELEPFYDYYKDRLKINKHMLLGYSNIVRYQGSENKPLTIFETLIDKNQESAFKVELSSETVILKFNDEKLLMRSAIQNKNIMNMYLYYGLYRAIEKFIEANNSDEEYIDVYSINTNQNNVLNQKILNLILNKGIQEINPDDIDGLISKISNKLIEKFVNSIEGMAYHGD
ncbi:hypothetical protein [Macrococcus capreoli]|uniref:hypothetical protein n=1 Tax=Macrococcus capreoli TaxID=2982690 RepID=UPI0021D56EE7|nr:hypothetical protein [Macrococcus sp. TMW 2.2395]MCU7558430.1 hypothetical protein [Macrococcus sp. TMW 2.2395]